jgi:hypothetical protein
VHSGEVFTTMVSWGDYAEYRYASLDGALIILSKTKDELILHPPSGKFDRDLLKKVVAFAGKEHAVFGFIKQSEKKLLSDFFPSLHCIEDRDYFDYVYRTADLAELLGAKYAKIRNRWNKFKKNVTYSIEDISEKNMDEVGDFLKRWCLWKDCGSDPLLESERKAIMFSMVHFIELGLSGVALRIQDTIEAIAVFEKMNVDTAVVHFEKGSPYYDGIYKAINRETAQRLSSVVPFIDREEDLGVAGLRQAKLSYHPHHFVEVFHVSKESLQKMSF